VAGITAALSFADQGFKSYIVEKKPALGGNYASLYYTLEGLDTKKHLAGLVDRVKKSDLITVFTERKSGRSRASSATTRPPSRRRTGKSSSSTEWSSWPPGVRAGDERVLYGQSDRVLTSGSWRS
jgi:hypothetical protein